MVLGAAALHAARHAPGGPDPISLPPSTVGVALFTPSNVTGTADVTSELEAFRAANPGVWVKVKEGSTVLLTNAFSTATTGDILLDLTGVTVKYNAMTSSDYAVNCDNTANASAEVTVSALSMVTVNSDAYVSRLTIGSTLAAKRFDWVAVYSTDANPAKSGGQLGEIFQLITDETGLTLTATRKLNRHAFYATTIRARKLDASRRVHIKGGTFTANGNTEDHTIISRSNGVRVIGFVDPLIEDVQFVRPWATGVRFQCNAAPRWRNVTMRDVGNLATYTGYTYGVTLYGMNDHADGRGLVVRNGRHAAFTTDGNSSGTATWYHKGIPTNAVVDGVHGYNCHASVVDTHEEGDNILISNVAAEYSYQDEDVAPNFSGLAVQVRAANVTVRGLFVAGGTRGIKVVAIDHGFEDIVTLEGMHMRDTTSAGDTDVGVQIDDQSAITNKRHVWLGGIFDNVGICVIAGRTAKVTVRELHAYRCDTVLDAQPGAQVVFTGPVVADYRGGTRSTPFFGVLCRSDVTYGGCTVVFLTEPKIVKGAASSPVSLLYEADTNASKPVFVAGLTEFNPSAVTGTLPMSGSTFVPAPVTRTAPQTAPGHLPANTLTGVGDSITNNTGALDPTSPSGNQLLAVKGWGPLGNALAGGQFSWVAPGVSGPGSVAAGSSGAAFALGGIYTDDILTGGYMAAAVASSADVIVVHIGTNNVNRGDTASKIVTDLLAIWRLGTAAGKRVVATTILPRDSTVITGAKLAVLNSVNQQVRALAAAEPNVFLCDWHAALLDSGGAAPSGGSASAYTIDGLHPNAAGGWRMGSVLAPVLAALRLPETPADWLPIDPADTLTPNPFATGNVSGVATSWTVTTQGTPTSITKTKVARYATDLRPGEMQQVATVAASASADGWTCTVSNANVGTDWSVGDTVYAACQLEADAAGWDCRHLQLDVVLSGSAVVASVGNEASSERTALTVPLGPAPVGGLVFVTPRIVVPAGVTTVRATLRFYGSGTVRILALGTRKVQ